MKGVNIEIKGIGLDKPTHIFIEELNKYIEDQNESNKNQNRFTAFGYWLSSFLCVLAVLIESWWFKKRFLT